MVFTDWKLGTSTALFKNRDAAYVPEMMQKGQVAPLEYSAQTIRDIIISARKQALISTLEQDLLNDARENGKFVIH